jgi:signal transduction histidine kinase
MWVAEVFTDAVSILVQVDVAAHTVTLTVEDNGVGVDPTIRPGGGLRNTAARATAAGGHSTIARRGARGRSFAWIVPLRSD